MFYLHSKLTYFNANNKCSGFTIVAISLFKSISLLEFKVTIVYSARFGLYEIDFEDPKRPHTPRKSALVYKHIIKTRTIDYDYAPDSLVMTIDEGH